MGERARRRARFIVVILGFTALVAADQRGWLLVPAGGDVDRYHGARVNVLRVLAGDHLEVDRVDEPGRRATTHVRVWGVACPARLRDTIATRVETLVGAQPVTLWLEPERTRSPSGGVVAHVELATGASLAETLLIEGLAVADDRLPHARLATHANAERHAKRRGLGVWSDQSW